MARDGPREVARLGLGLVLKLRKKSKKCEIDTTGSGAVTFSTYTIYIY